MSGAFQGGAFQLTAFQGDGASVTGVLGTSLNDATASVSAAEQYNASIGVTTGSCTAQFSVTKADNVLVTIAAGQLTLAGNAPEVLLTGHDSQSSGPVVTLPDLIDVREPSKRTFVRIPKTKFMMLAHAPTIGFERRSRSKWVRIPAPAMSFRSYAPRIHTEYNDDISIEELLAVMSILEAQDGA